MGGGAACALAVWILITLSSTHAKARQSVLKENDLRTLVISRITSIAVDETCTWGDVM
jgi:hypothetical protein